MTPELTFVYSYYENPKMFQIQQRIWGSYPEYLQRRLEVIVTDDCSSEKPLKPKHIIPMQYGFQAYRIQKKVPWNWLEARNIGAKHAQGKWLLLTDMDHVVSPKVLSWLLNHLQELNADFVYQFSRVLSTGEPYKFHNDSFFVQKDLFWRCGGYDEDYAGNYGTSGMFRRRLFDAAAGNHLFIKLPLVLYSRDVVADASTRDLPRKEGRFSDALTKIKEWKNQTGRSIQHFLQPYERIS